MINEKELEIANISYTNKDFGAIYTEILDTARKLSDLWAPQSSNESDPGVVLLKLLAFVGDKLNYNIDKNVLETMMPSATQESSMRKLCDMMGYYMNYYNSASTYVTFTYRGHGLDRAEDEGQKFITFPRFKTVVSNEDNSLQYVIWDEDVSLSSISKTATVLAKEGFLNTLNVGDSDKITLDNLDSQNRIYFGESQVAQNGILIRAYNSMDSGAKFWTRVENLNVQDPGATCFKFGYDSKEKLPYIEFPQDIASLIGEGLYIRYLVTSGYYGNVGVGNLSKLLSPTSVAVTGGNEPSTISFTDEGNAELNIKNNSAATNGADPESIDSAYNNFKKTVGTFQTLVTCRDYANYIYNYLYTSSGNHLVSNVQVGDRRVDLNHASNIVTYGETGQYNVNTSTDYTNLFIYALEGINNPANQSEYKKSFSLMSDTTSIIEDLNSDESAATISYNYNFPQGDDIALIKILYNLDAKITTSYKVNVAEQLDIRKNIIEAVRQKFYSRNIDFGYEIPYDSIYTCILNADERIKAVSLKEPDLGISYIDSTNTIKPTYGTPEGKDLGDDTATPYADSPYLTMLAKNVLAGKVPLFDYDTRFNYEFGMEEVSGTGPILSNVQKFDSVASINLSNTSVEINKNEVVQFIGPKLVDEVEYSTYVNYYTNRTFVANEDTTLGPSEYILFVYTDSSQNQVEVLYTEGDVIKSSFDIPEVSPSTITKSLTDSTIISKLHDLHISDDTSALPMHGIPTSSSIIKRAIVSHRFTSTLKAAWLLDDVVDKNTISDKFIEIYSSSDLYIYEYILKDTDYFIYSIDGESSYEIFGSGTSIRVESSTQITNFDSIFGGTCQIPNLNDLYEYGLESVASILKTISFASGISIVVQANNILSLSQGDLVKGPALNLDNTWKPVVGDVYYTLFNEGQETHLPTYNIGSEIYNKWRVRSRLDLVSGPNKTQELLSGQSITFYTADDSYTISGVNIRTNIGVDISGGLNIPLNMVDPTSVLIEEGDEPIYPLSVLVFADPEKKVENFTRSSGYYTKELDGDFSFDYSILHPDSTGDILVLCYLSFLSGQTGTVTFDGGSGVTLENYGDGSVITSVSSSEGTKMMIIKIPHNCTNLTITKSGDTDLGKIILGQLNPIEGYNSRFKLDEIETAEGIASGSLSTALGKLISYYDSDNLFYYNCNLDASEEIDEEDLSSPFAVFDSNNIANRFAIAYIDIDGSNIEITRSSKA